MTLATVFIHGYNIGYGFRSFAYDIRCRFLAATTLDTAFSLYAYDIRYNVSYVVAAILSITPGHDGSITKTGSESAASHSAIDPARH